MDRKIVTPLVLFAVSFVIAGNAGAQDSDIVHPPSDFRVAVKTNSSVYHNKDILRLTVELLNDGAAPVQVERFEEPRPLDPVEGELAEGVLDDDAVDLVIRPWWPTIIGYARLTPLDFRIRTLDAADGISAPEIAYRLPLFGSPVIRPHSTRIISTANILIMCPTPEPVDPAPAPADAENTVAVDQRPRIDGVGKYYAVRPGRYLLEVNIDRIAGTRIAQAQKIILIRPRKVSPAIRLLRDNNAGIRRLNRHAEVIAEAVRKDLMYAIYNNKYIRAIYRLLTGDATTAIAPDRTEATLRRKRTLR